MNCPKCIGGTLFREYDPYDGGFSLCVNCGIRMYDRTDVIDLDADERERKERRRGPQARGVRL